MQYLKRILKAIPWGFIGRVSFKLLRIVFIGLLFVAGKAIAFCFDMISAGSNEEEENKGNWSSCSPDARWTRIDYVPCGRDETD